MVKMGGPWVLDLVMLTIFNVPLITAGVPKTDPKPGAYPHTTTHRTKWTSPLHRAATPEVHAFSSRCGWKPRGSLHPNLHL